MNRRRNPRLDSLIFLEREEHVVPERIYQKLESLGVLKVKEHARLKSSGFMDLVIERLGDSRYSLSHYYEQNGDLVPDPDMEIRVFPDMRMAEALTYQDSFGFRCVHDDGKIDAAAKKELNAFLEQWLTNLIEQGFRAGEISC